MLRCLVYLSTGTGRRWRQLELSVHVSILSTVTGAVPHLNNLLPFRQEVVVVLLCFWHHVCLDDAQLLNVADSSVDRLVSGCAFVG